MIYSDAGLRFVPEAAADASAFLFHSGQKMHRDDDGLLFDRFNRLQADMIRLLLLTGCRRGRSCGSADARFGTTR